MGKVRRSIKNILVTGADGFIGSHMVKYLLEQEKYNVFKSEGDLRDPEVVSQNMKRIDCVFHFAANMGGVGFFSEENYYPILDNFTIDLNILKACEKHKVKRLFYASSACAYNVTYMESGEPLRESMIDFEAKPDQMYGWEKLTMLKLMRFSPVDCRVGILHTIYGEGQEYTGKRAKAPPQIAYNCYEASKTKTKRITVWGDGTQRRTFQYVGDAVRKIYAVTMHKNYWGEVNIGSDKEVTVDEVVNTCAEILKFTPKIKHDLSKPTGPKRRACDNDKFKQRYHIREEVDLKEGFKRLIQFIKLNERKHKRNIRS